MILMRRRTKQRPVRLAVAAGGAMVSAGGLVAWRKTRFRAAVTEAMPGATSGPSAPQTGPLETRDPAEGHEAADSGRQPWHCECGQGYLVSGQDRHQIYWLEDADESDPVLSDNCPNCDRPLPAVSRANAAD